jgi:uncharacterized coiled-coil protein SlyX
MLIMWIEIFKTGEHTDSQGSAGEFTAESLDGIVSLYNEKVLEDSSFLAPVVKGHPATSDPALGWVERLARRGDFLVAKLKDVDPDFADEVERGCYRKISISLYPDRMLRHVGFLGGAQPAVHGLRTPNLGADSSYREFESPTGEIITASTDSDRPAHDSSNLLDFDSEESVPSDDSNATIPDENEALNRSESRTAELESRLGEMSVIINECDKKITSLETDYAESRNEVSRLEQTIQAMTKTARLKEFREYVNSLVERADGAVITPAQADDLVGLLELAHDFDSSRRAEGNYSESEKSGIELVKSFVSSLNTQVSFAEYSSAGKLDSLLSESSFANHNVSFSRLAVHERAKALQQSTSTLSYEEAVELALQEG